MDFTDLSSLSSISPHKSESTKSNSKKRGINATGRLRLLPLDSASGGGGNYDGSNAGNNNNNNNSSSSSGATLSPMLPAGFGKLKKITQKKELLEAVRKANSPIILPMREPLGSGVLRHESSSSSLVDNNDSSASSAARDIECLEDGVRANAKKFNDHKMLADRRHRELSVLMDELRALQLETHELSRLQSHDTPVARQSQRIRDEIHDCTAAMEQQLHVRRQLEHMTRRLHTGQLKVDAHLEAMTKAVDASLREADEVKLLCRQLEAGKSKAIQFLQDVQIQLQMDRKTRARELTDTEIRAKNAQKMEAWRLQRMHERAEMAAELRGDLSADEELRLLRCIESRERANDMLHIANRTKSQRAADYDDVLAQLKMAMGATSLQEVVEKIQAQSVTGVSLDKEKALAETKLLSVRQDKEHAVQTLNELKASGIGGMELNREVYNTLEKEIQQARATLKVNKAAYERLDGVVQAVHQGSYGLTQRLQAFDGVLDLSHIELQTVAATMTTGPLLLTPTRMDNAECLALAELKLTKMVELLGQQSTASSSFGSSSGSGAGFGSGIGADDGGFGDDAMDDRGTSRGGADFADELNAVWSPTCNSDPVLHHNNIRVAPGRFALLGNHVVDRDDENDDEEHARQVDSARSDRSATASDVGGDFMDVHVPSRDILKMSSSRHFAEVLRKREMAEKQKAAAERGISDEEMLSKLRKKTQLDADARLATSPHKAAAKSFAFVTQQLHFHDLS